MYNLMMILSVNIFILFAFIIIELLFGNWIFKSQINKLNIRKNISVNYKLNGLYDYEKRKTIYYSRDKFGLRGLYC